MNHIRSDGSVVKITDMSDGHLITVIVIHQRKAKEGVMYLRGGGNTAEDIWYDEETLFGLEALEFLNHSAYLNEAKRRGVQVKE